ncbi:MAG: AI-2E family transporter [Myxococcota bacterium]
MKPDLVFWRRYERYPYLLAKTVFFLLVAAAVFYLLRSISGVLSLVVLAMLVAYVLDPAVDWFEDRGYSRTTGIVLFLTMGAFGVLMMIGFLYPTIAHLVKVIGEGLTKLPPLDEIPALAWISHWFDLDLKAFLAQATERYQSQVPALLQEVGSALTQATTRLLQQTTVLVGAVINLALIPVLAFFFLRDFDEMKDRLAQYLPRHQEAWMVDRLRQMDQVVGAWIRGQIEVSLILAAMYAIGLAITFSFGQQGASSGLAIGVFAGLLNIVPYLGFLVGFVLALLVAIIDWHGWGPLVGVLLTFGVVQTIEGYVVTPRIVGEKVGLSPVAVIIALLLGAEVLGLLGVLLAIPVVGSLRVLMPDLIAWYQRSDIFLGDAAGREEKPDPEEATQEARSGDAEATSEST